MRYSFDALSGLVTTHFGMNPLCGHIFVFLSRRRDRIKLLFWDSNGFALYYKRLESSTFSWIQDLDLEDGGEIQASDFAMILMGINPLSDTKQKRPRNKVTPGMPPSKPPLQLV